jgi:hypothetical protein
MSSTQEQLEPAPQKAVLVQQGSEVALQLDAAQQQGDGHAAIDSTDKDSSSGVRKKVKRNVALHVGYVGTGYTGVLGLSEFGPGWRVVPWPTARLFLDT